MPALGEPAPDFTLRSDDGRQLSLKDFRGKKVVLYFYPKDDTSGCTTESCEFRDLVPRFAKVNAQVLGISPDGVKSHVVSVIEGHELYLRTQNGRFEVHWVDPFGGETEEQVGEDKIVAPLPGTVVALLAEVGATLEKGAPILTLEVMKMEQTLRAPYAGVLKTIKCKVGDIVGEGVELAEVEPAA